jgi:1-pyrroline-4-hydroxy-2-carboxylate deaminase
VAKRLGPWQTHAPSPNVTHMKTHVTWQGVFPAITTQLHQDQSLDLEGTARHMEVLIESGISGIILLGSLGENQALDPAEKRDVMRAAIETVRGRIPV